MHHFGGMLLDNILFTVLLVKCLNIDPEFLKNISAFDTILNRKKYR